MTESLTFEKLPEAVTMLTKEVSELKRLLIEKQEQPTTDQPEQLLTIQEAAEFLSLFLIPFLVSRNYYLFQFCVTNVLQNQNIMIHFYCNNLIIKVEKMGFEPTTS